MADKWNKLRNQIVLMVILHNTAIKIRLLIPLSNKNKQCFLTLKLIWFNTTTLKIILTAEHKLTSAFFNNARKSFIVELLSLAKLQGRKCRGIWQKRSHVTYKNITRSAFLKLSTGTKKFRKNNNSNTIWNIKWHE